MGPGLNYSEIQIAKAFPTTNMTASLNGSKVDF